MAGALDHIAHEPDLDGRAFHLTDPEGQRVDEVFNEFAAAAHAPQFAVNVDRRLTDAVPRWPLALLMRMPPITQARRLALRELGIPAEVFAHMELIPTFGTRETEQALKGSALEHPPLCMTMRPGSGITGSARWTISARAAPCRRSSAASTC